MTYTPPDGDTVTFEAEPYDAPSGDAVGFDFSQLVLVNPDAVTLNLDTPAPFVSSGTIIAPDAIIFELNTPAPLVSPGRLIEPRAVELDLAVPEPFVSPGVPIRPDAVELNLATPNAFIQPFLLRNEWQVRRERLQPVEIEGDAETLSLSFVVESGDIDSWRQFERSGGITTEDGFGGAFRTLGRDGGGDVEVRPPFTRMRPFQPSADYRVDGYAETQVSPDRFEVALDLQRTRNRGEAFPALSETGVFELGLSHGTVGLSERQVGQIDRDGAPAGAEVSMELLVSDDQAAALLDNLGYPRGVVERSVPDGPNKRVDESGGRQTITLTAPADVSIDSGQWYVTDWSLSFNGYSKDSQWAIELALVDTGA